MEIMVQEDKFRTWFNGGTVISGNFCIATEINVVFMVLPYLISAHDKGNNFRSLDQIVVDEDYPIANILEYFIDSEDLSQISDSKDVDGSFFYRYNEDLTLQWLAKRVNKLYGHLRQRNEINVSSSSRSSDFVENIKNDKFDESYLVYAHGLVSDYICSDLSNKLRIHLNLPEVIHLNKFESEKKKRKIADHCFDENDNKKNIKVNPTEDYSIGISNITNKPKKLTIAQKKLEKVDKKGIKNISSFFKKKN